MHLVSLRKSGVTLAEGVTGLFLQLQVYALKALLPLLALPALGST
jgi:hypothetical protein